RGLRALHVPRMEVLVAREREEPLVIARHALLAPVRQVVAAEDQAGGRAMLESAVAVPDDEAQEPVALERRRAPEQLDLRLANLLQVRGHALEIGLEPSGHDEVMRHARGFELHA